MYTTVDYVTPDGLHLSALCKSTICAYCTAQLQLIVPRCYLEMVLHIPAFVYIHSVEFVLVCGFVTNLLSPSPLSSPSPPGFHWQCLCLCKFSLFILFIVGLAVFPLCVFPFLFRRSMCVLKMVVTAGMRRSRDLCHQRQQASLAVQATAATLIHCEEGKRQRLFSQFVGCLAVGQLSSHQDSRQCCACSW